MSLYGFPMNLSAHSLNSYLMLLCDKQFDIVVDIYNPDIWKDPSYVYLFENLGVSMDQVTEDTDCIVIKKGGESAEALRGFFTVSR